MNALELLELLLGIAGLLLLTGSIVWAGERRERNRTGRLLSVDLPGSPAGLLRSARWKLAGRPDEIRELPNGARIPVEVKSRRAYATGPPASHRAQVAAYCLLLEEATGVSPPYGIVRYADGAEFRVPWDDGQRAWLWTVRREMARPYDGRAAASPGKCRACAFHLGCDRSMAGS
jgi:CRISPR-associated exonuclease Cas4